jgi:anti-sigma B factor antagonist
MFNFEYEKVGKNGDIVAVVLEGMIDETNCEYLLKCVAEEILEGHTKLILDCGKLTYISSMGLGMLVRVHSRMKKLGGDVKLADVHTTVAQIISVVGLNRLFHIFPTVDDAIAALDAG